MFIGFILFCAWYKSPKQKGRRGEKHVFQELCKLPEGYHILNDCILTTDRGTTQIDHLVVSRCGVFVIETKNYRGEIYGDDDRQEWKQIIVTKVRYNKKWWKVYTYVTKNEFYNPVRQARGHAAEIRKNLADLINVPIVPIVVFTGRANISNVKTNNVVVYDYELVSTICRYNVPVISEQQVLAIKERINERNVRAVVDDRTHIHNVKNVAKQVNNTIRAGICPRCGGRLIEKKGKYGRFCGCSNYPRCKFTQNI